MLQAILKESDQHIVCFDDIWEHVKDLETSERGLISQVIKVCKLVLLNPSTSASGVRSFSAAQ